MNCQKQIGDHWSMVLWRAIAAALLATLPLAALAQSVPILDSRLILPRDYSKPAATVVGVQITPDGSTVLSAQGNAVQVWDAKTGDKLRELVGHDAAVSLIRLDSGGRLVASTASDKSLRVWDVASGTVVRDFGIQEQTVRQLAFTRDNGLVTVEQSGKVTLLNLSDGAQRRSFMMDPKRFASAAFDADATRLVVAYSRDCSLALYDIRTGQLLATHEGNGSPHPSVGRVAFSPDGKVIAYYFWEGLIGYWRLGEEGKDDVRPFQHPNGVKTLAFSSDGRWLVVGLRDDKEQLSLQVWEVSSRKLRGVLKGHDEVRDMALADNGGTLVSTGANVRTVRVWDMPHAGPAELQEKWARYARDLEAARFGEGLAIDEALAFSPDGKTLASQGNSEIALWDMERRTARATLSWQADFVPDMKHLRSEFLSDRLLLTLTHDGGVRWWDIATGQVVKRRLANGRILTRHLSLGSSGQTALFHVENSPTYKGSGILAESNNDGSESIEVRHVGSGEQRSRFETRDPGIWGWLGDARYLESSNALVACVKGEKIALLDAASGKEQRVFTEDAGAGPFCQLALSKDEALVAAAGRYGRVWVWEVKTGRLLFEVDGGVRDIKALTFSPDGKTLLIGAKDAVTPGSYGGREVMTLDAYAIPSGKRSFAVPGFVVGSVAAIAFHPDGTSFVTAHATGRRGQVSGLRMWDAVTGAPKPR